MTLVQVGPTRQERIRHGTVASSQTPSVRYETRSASSIGRWYQDAVIAALQVLSPAETTDVRSQIAVLDLFHSLGVTAVVLPVSVGGSRSLTTSGAPTWSDDSCAEVVRVERLLAEAHARHLRVLIDTNSPCRRMAHAFRSCVDAGRFWLSMGADGVVVPNEAAEARCVRESVRAGDVAQWFVPIAGVPVPIGDDDLAALATFRRAVSPAILEGIEQASANPLAALLVQLAVQRARCAGCAHVDGAARGADRPVRALASGGATLDWPAADSRRQRLLDRLVFSLPGPLLLGRDCELDGGGWVPDASVDASARRSSDIKTLVAWRMGCAALRFGQPFPVSLGGGAGVAFIAESGHEATFVAANFGTTSLDLQLDLNGYQGRRVVDITRGIGLARLTEGNHRVTLDPLECRWFHLMSG